MHEECTCPVRNRLNRTFCDSILEVGTNSAEHDSLVQHFKVVKEFLRGIGVVVSSIAANVHAVSMCKPFK